MTGDKEFFDTAVGIGHNIQRLLEQPVFQKSGQANARETGWALRSLCALFKETNDSSWLEKCDWIVGHFHEWEDEYGLWLAPYTDNSAIRVVFMISIAKLGPDITPILFVLNIFLTMSGKNILVLSSIPLEASVTDTF